MQEFSILTFQKTNQNAVFFFVGFNVIQQITTQSGGKRERYHQRSNNGRNVGNAQRSEDFAFDSLHIKQRQKHQYDNDGSINNGVSDLRTGMINNW